MAPSPYAKPKRDHLFIFMRDVLSWRFLKCDCRMVIRESVVLPGIGLVRETPRMNSKGMGQCLCLHGAPVWFSGVFGIENPCSKT